MDLLLHLVTQFVLKACGQDGDLRILAERVVGGRSPDNVDIRIELGKEVIDLLQFPDEDRMLIAGIDIK